MKAHEVAQGIEDAVALIGTSQAYVERIVIVNEALVIFQQFKQLMGNDARVIVLLEQASKDGSPCKVTQTPLVDQMS